MSIKRAPYKGIALPDEKFLIVRPSFTAICMGNKPASKLISALLFCWNPDNEQNLEAATQFTVTPTQNALVEAICGECTSKTIHDVAIPCLQLFGYLDINESTSPITYTVHLDVIRERLQMYSCKRSELEEVLIRIAANMCPEIKENKKKFYLSLEEVLIANRRSSNSDGKSSNSRRGRKPSTEARSVAQKQTPKNSKNTKKKKEEETQKTAHAVGDVSFSHLQDTLFGDTSPSKQEKAATPTTSPSVKPMKTKTQKTETPRYISRPSTKTEPVVASEQEQRIVEVWSSIFKRPLPLNDAIILAARRLARCEPTVDDLRECRAFCYKSNPDWFGLQGRTRGRVTLKDVADYWEGWQSSLDALPTSTQSEKPATKIQQQLQEKAPDFVFLTTDKLMELPLAERKAYNAAMRAAIRANEEKQAVNA